MARRSGALIGSVVHHSPATLCQSRPEGLVCHHQTVAHAPALEWPVAPAPLAPWPSYDEPCLIAAAPRRPALEILATASLERRGRTKNAGRNAHGPALPAKKPTIASAPPHRHSSRRRNLSHRGRLQSLAPEQQAGGLMRSGGAPRAHAEQHAIAPESPRAAGTQQPVWARSRWPSARSRERRLS